MNPKDGNAKLSADQEKLVTYLIQNGHDPYSGTRAYDFGADKAIQNGDGSERASLQIFLWSVSDPVDLAENNSTNEIERQTTCADNMGSAEQARLLALIPDEPAVNLSFADSGGNP